MALLLENVDIMISDHNRYGTLSKKDGALWGIMYHSLEGFRMVIKTDNIPQER
jgi:hypothetical protein